MILLLFLSLSLSAEYRCEMHLDAYDIHHIKGRSQWDAFACLGHLHGEQRAFQMNYFRLVAQGKQAEVKGFKALKSDFFLRLMDLTSLAKRLHGEMDENGKKWLSSYADGVNEGFKKGVKKDPQFDRWGITPTPWQPWHSLLLFLLQSLDQTKSSFFNEIKEDKVLKKYPDAFSSSPPWETTILKSDEYKIKEKNKNKPVVFFKKHDPSLEDFLQDFHFSTGSNNWAIAPSRSFTKNAWLANDPHLATTHPPFWFWVHLKGGKMDVAGATVPGLPTFPVGLNKHVAWGLTNAYVDVARLALIDEKEVENLQVIRPRLYFKFLGLKLPFFFKTFKRTKTGLPILPISDVPDGKVYVLKWSSFFLKGDHLSPLYGLLTAGSSKDLDTMLAKTGLPTWNYVFADNKGNIGYRAIGLLPFQKNPFSLGVKEMSLSEFEKPFLFFDKSQVPHIFNPKRGYVATANNNTKEMMLFTPQDMLTGLHFVPDASSNFSKKKRNTT